MNKFEFTKCESDFTGTHASACFIHHSMDEFFTKSLIEEKLLHYFMIVFQLPELFNSTVKNLIFFSYFPVQT